MPGRWARAGPWCPCAALVHMVNGRTRDFRAGHSPLGAAYEGVAAHGGVWSANPLGAVYALLLQLILGPITTVPCCPFELLGCTTRDLEVVEQFCDWCTWTVPSLDV